MEVQTDDDIPFTTHTDLNETLTSLPIFSCKKCDGFLTPPIRLVDGVGHVCGLCVLSETEVSIIDPAFELVLENLTISCPNKSKGCKQKCNYIDISSHAYFCLKRNYQCPLMVVTDCTWKGASWHILEHVTVSHPGNVIKAYDGIFSLRVDVSADEDTVKILQMGFENFIAQTKYDATKCTMCYLVFYIGSKEKAQEYSYSVEETVNVGPNSAVQHNGESDVLFDFNFGSDECDSKAVSIDLSLIKKLTQQPIVEAVIRVFKKKRRHKEEDESNKIFLNSFECPICNNFMRPPIFQCLSGHSVCQDCKPKLQRCSFCSAKFGTTRNYSLESLSSHVKFPCQYQDNGCDVALPLPNIDEHEAECEVKPFNCPFCISLKCSWRGTHCNILPHLKELHIEKCSFLGFIKGRFNINGDNSEETCCIVTNGNAFRICFKRDEGDVFWAIQYVGPQSRVKNYMYELAFLDTENDNRKLVWSDVCHNLNFQNNADQFTKFPREVFSCFPNKCVIYYCKISPSITKF